MLREREAASIEHVASISESLGVTLHRSLLCHINLCLPRLFSDFLLIELSFDTLLPT